MWAEFILRSSLTASLRDCYMLPKDNGKTGIDKRDSPIPKGSITKEDNLGTYRTNNTKI